MNDLIEIRRWDTNELIIDNKDNNCKSIRELVEYCVKHKISLAYADLRGADLRGANLAGAVGIHSFQAGKSNRLCYAVRHEDRIMFQIGCFWENTEEVIKEIRDKYGDNSNYEELVLIYTDMLMNERY